SRSMVPAAGRHPRALPAAAQRDFLASLGRRVLYRPLVRGGRSLRLHRPSLAVDGAGRRPTPAGIARGSPT
ncbi:MAG: hypothetical protein QF438_01105, partial [Phycisphaerales bacterium]|nr:hypothetical protein [Phycisphaerales bacterium]